MTRWRKKEEEKKTWSSGGSKANKAPSRRDFREIEEGGFRKFWNLGLKKDSLHLRGTYSLGGAEKGEKNGKIAGKRR